MLCVITFAVFLTLKLCGAVDWSWGWVIMPMMAFLVAQLAYMNNEI